MHLSLEWSLSCGLEICGLFASFINNAYHVSQQDFVCLLLLFEVLQGWSFMLMVFVS